MTKFEEALCERIEAICNYSRTPEKEMNVQLALSLDGGPISNALINLCYKQEGVSSSQDIRDKYAELCKGRTTFQNAKVEERAAKCQYIATTINKNEILSEQSFKDFPLFSTDMEVKGLPPAFDIVYNDKDLLEIKYPRNEYRWNFSQWGSPERMSTCPFKTPFLNIDNDNYIMGMAQEGQMFVDFMRLLKAKEVGFSPSGKIDNLYFATFFKRSEFPKGSSEEEAKKQFENQFSALLNQYFSTKFKYIITEGKDKKIDIWDAEKPGGIKFFFKEERDFKDGIFTSSKPSFECLHWGDRMVAFLLKLTPWREGTLIYLGGTHDITGTSRRYRTDFYIRPTLNSGGKNDLLVPCTIPKEYISKGQTVWFKQSGETARLDGEDKSLCEELLFESPY